VIISFAMNSFQKIKRGLEILAPYKPECLTCNPVNLSFPNGAPDHARSAYLNIEVSMGIWDMKKTERDELISLGFRPEQQDQYWIHFGG
jgi:hypothetical protein